MQKGSKMGATEHSLLHRIFTDNDDGSVTRYTVSGWRVLARRLLRVRPMALFASNYFDLLALHSACRGVRFVGD